MVGPFFISSFGSSAVRAQGIAQIPRTDSKPAMASYFFKSNARDDKDSAPHTSAGSTPARSTTHHQRLEDSTVSLRRCAWHNCPQLVPQGTRFCKAHAHAYERQRGSSTARGYDAPHRHLRRAWEARLATGETHTCAKCGQPVTAADQWDLGHTDNRQSWTGPEHRSCNRQDGQHKATASIEHWTRH